MGKGLQALHAELLLGEREVTEWVIEAFKWAAKQPSQVTVRMSVCEKESVIKLSFMLDNY